MLFATLWQWTEPLLRLQSPSSAANNTTAAASGAATACDASRLTLPPFFGLTVLAITAHEIHNWTDYVPVSPPLPIPDPPPPSGLHFCNITVTYTHPGWHDRVHTTLWAPLGSSSTPRWNGRFVGQGGGGWAARAPDQLWGAVALGYAAADTDAGHASYGSHFDTVATSRRWSLRSPGNVDLPLLDTFGVRAYEELARIGKAVVVAFYGRAPEFSYWNGCSTGGRQGMLLAQRFPGQFDGILAVAPAINWVTFVVTSLWPLVVMNKAGYYPPACEVQAIEAAAVEACDELDGLKDGVVADDGGCRFDAREAVARTFDCEGDTRKISAQAAEVVNAAWDGPARDGERVWFGLSRDAPLTGAPGSPLGLVKTKCDAKNRHCRADPFLISADWVRQFVFKDPEYDVAAMTEDDFFHALDISRREYFSTMDTSNPDLRDFQRAGGKLLSWHGLADGLIAPNGTWDYHARVAQVSPDVQDFFRVFAAPGVGHCRGGKGPLPVDAFNQLVEWVEKGVAPEELKTREMPWTDESAKHARPVCQHPKVAAYRGGDSCEASSFECVDSFEPPNPGREDL